MLQFFRNFTKSRFGLVAVFLFLGIIALAFAAGDITGLRSSMTGNGGGDVVAVVGKRKITDREVREKIDLFLRNLQREGRNVTMAQFMAQGGMELALEEIINQAALVEYSKQTGMQVSKKLVDGDIASNPSFFGMDGKFSQKTFEDVLAQNRIAPALYRESLTQDRYGNWLINRATLSDQLPTGVITPYASLLLERRAGIVGLVSTIAMDPGADPDDRTLNAYYTSQRARYTVPERRIVRYAVVKPDALRAQSAATDAEIADAYKKAGTRFAATEKRTVELVTALDQNTATQIAAKAKGGTLAAAATAAGLEARTIAAAERAALGQQVSAPFADAAFAAAANALTGPTRIGTSWYVFRVTKIEQVAAKSLEQAKPELATAIAQRKLAVAMANTRQALEDGVGNGKTFDEAAAAAKLTAQRTPALTANALNPDDPASKPDPLLAPIMRAGFAFEQVGDEPQVIPVAADGSAALVALEKVVPAAPRPLASIRDQVKKDYLVDQALQKARVAANAVVAKLEKGVPMAQALAEAGVHKGPPPKPFDFKRADILGRQMEPYIQMAFGMAPKKAKIVPGPNRVGFYVVYLDQVEQHSAANDPVAMARVKGDLSPQVGPEYARQFIAAIRDHIKVKRNEAVVSRVRAELLRNGASAR